MKSREETVSFIEKQFKDDGFMKGCCSHYGKEALRQLLDFIYEGDPKKKNEFLLGEKLR